MTTHQTVRADGRRLSAPTPVSLVRRLADGEQYALAFGGQGSAWLEPLADIARDSALEPWLAELVDEADAVLAPIARKLLVARPSGFDPLAWSGDATPSDAVLRSAAVSFPGVLLTQLAALRALRMQGLDVSSRPPAAVLGHSQGVLAVASTEADGADDVELLAVAQLIGAAAITVARQKGLVAIGDAAPMVAVSNVDPAELTRIVDELMLGMEPADAAQVSMINGRRRAVVSGPPAQVRRVRLRCQEIGEQQSRARAAKETGGRVFAPVFESLAVEVGFHHPALTDAVALVGDWAALCGVDVDRAVALAHACLVDTVDWVRTVSDAVDSGAGWILDMGPDDASSRLTASVARGTGIGVVAAATRPGRRALLVPGATPVPDASWTRFAPDVVTLPDGRIVVETAFTRATGRSPILLAGMTPTTVDAGIVAAAANAGHWAELAGGGQVTEEIFDARVAELRTLLEPGRSVQFNALFLDPYLWKLQLGGKRLLQRARAAGAPFDGVVISAGVPELDDAVALVHELADAGIAHIAFKPGTVAQIRSVLRIADELPDRTVLMHVEGGHAGGHHSWEDLDDLLLDTYADIRVHENVVVCVGGGIGTPERAAEFLTGTWSMVHGCPAMPVDGVLVGTAAMATLEATTSEQVKRLLVDTQGTTEWVGAGSATGGMASGRSQLGADIHEIDNAASRAGRLLDEVAGDADAVAARRDEVIAALNDTAKPYFGDVESMTYLRWLERYVELAVHFGGTDPHDDFECGCDVGAVLCDVMRSPWLDAAWRERFVSMVQRTEARLHAADNGPIPTSFIDTALFDRPADAVRLIRETYPDADNVVLHPADVSFFVELCKIPGKPVSFVPVVDADVRRWWRSDSLWQAHDARYSADQVCVIPGTVAVAGITRMNEPVGALLNRFEAGTADALLAAGQRPRAVAGRRTDDASSGALGVALAAPDVQWCGRTTTNPVRRLGRLGHWTVDGRRATHSSTGAQLIEIDDRVELTVPVGERTVRIVVDVPRIACDGGAPLVSDREAGRSMTELLAAAAGQELPRVKGPTSRINVAWTPDSVAEHSGVTASGLPAELGASPRGVPDVVVGACWPAVFAVLGAARTGSGMPVIEGMLDLVHLDHRVQLHRELPSDTGILTVRARSTSVRDTAVGRVIEVRVDIGGMDAEHGMAAPPLATLVERFAIRGRTGASEFTVADTAAPDASATPRRRRRSTTITTPTDLRAFAEVSGDHNPIHTSAAAAALAGLDGPIVHGMWLSAAAQQVVVATDSAGPGVSRRLTSWSARFVGMVAPGAEVAVTVDRIGRVGGGEVVEVTCTVDGDPVLLATATTAAPVTAYVFPGQGIQRRGMGLDARARSKAARQVWDRADAHTRSALGFSILAVVRDNPTSLWARGVEHRHPDGVLHLTQFTQVAMATLGVAQVAELREAGVFTEGALLAGHSVGEYNALAAIANVLPLEALLEVVFQRGSAMHDLVPRDDHGRSNYRMAAVRPSQIGLSDADVHAFVAAAADRAGEFLEVVNLNLRGSQYAVAGTVAGLAELESDIEARRARFGGKRAFVLVPGIDVPFHSTVLRTGVPEFRSRLQELLPSDLDPELLVGRYVPNLVPKPFCLDRAFVAEIAELVPSEPLREVLRDYDSWRRRPHELCRVVLIELLAWQFASPVRWIETQDLLFSAPEADGLGVERLVEVGLGAMPTVANLATQTLALPDHAGAAVEVLNLERDAAVVFGTDSEPTDDGQRATDTPEQPERDVTTPVETDSGATTPRPSDIPFTAADATRTLVALWTKLRPEQIGAVDTIEGLCDGVSSRRNQLLVDLGSELSLGAIDGAADSDMVDLATTVDTLARTYRAFGPVLTEATSDRIRKVFGPSGRRATAIGDRVRDVWQLGAGWAQHVHAEVALGTREGTSVRGGDLGHLVGGPIVDAASVDAVIDAAIEAVAERRGVDVTLPVTGEAASVDPAALEAFTSQITGRDGVLASAARSVLNKLGLDDAPSALEPAVDTDLVDAVATELGSDWPRLVAPAFDARRAVLLDDRWASAREDLARMWVDDRLTCRVDGFVGSGEAVAAQARWWSEKAVSFGRRKLAAVYDRVADAAERPTPEGRPDVAVVTGASPGSIAAAVIAELLAQGATVIATTSQLDDQRLEFHRKLYRDNARAGAALWVVPANMASYADIDALVDWIGSETSESVGATTTVVKPALTPTLLFPFAAPRVAGTLVDAGARAEMEMRVLLWSVERLMGRLAAFGADHDVDSRLHVVLPGSPNRGLFGGDGAYGEAKAAFDAVVARWGAERTWAQRVTLVHAMIGWVRGTGLMGHNDPLVHAVEAGGVRTWSPAEMAAELVELCATTVRAEATSAPVVADLTGGLREADLDLAALAGQRIPRPERDEASVESSISALPAPPTSVPATVTPEWGAVDADPSDLVVVVGAGELGPYGSARTRFEMEVDDRLSAAGVLELAWSTGLVSWENAPVGGWYDAETGELVPEAEIADRYHDLVVARCGLRRYEDDGAMIDNSAPLLTSVFLDQDLTFSVGTEAEAHAFAAADPGHTVVRPCADGDWAVTRKAGTEIRVPRRAQLSRTVGGQIPTGFDPTRWGISSDMANAIDRVALWNVVATVDAFIGAGVTPAELMRWVHPSMVANTQGTGMGGMTSLRGLYIDALLGESRANDILQEALPNVVAAHVVQSYVGSYGAMVHPVAACATAAVSVEEGVDKITLGKAEFVVAGGFDDIGVEGIVGFGDMAATAVSEDMSAKGISDRRFSRANDRRRGGFVESHGGGTILLARGDVAEAMGLPVLGVVAHAQSFGDGVHTSIPAPGIGALGAGRDGRESRLAASLRRLGVGADDIAVVSKHDTSTAANDPNEAELHERLAAALGRSDGAPLFVVSQKSLTGHAKGGAAAFQLIGLCQLLDRGVIPPNRSLDCVDDVMKERSHLVWPRETLRFDGRFPLRAGLLTSLGFGHVSGLVAVVHPEAFVQSLPPEARADYRRRARERAAWGRQRRAQAMCGGAPLYERPVDRRLGAVGGREREATMLLDGAARLGADDTYGSGT